MAWFFDIHIPLALNAQQVSKKNIKWPKQKQFNALLTHCQFLWNVQNIVSLMLFHGMLSFDRFSDTMKKLKNILKIHKLEGLYSVLIDGYKQNSNTFE